MSAIYQLVQRIDGHLVASEFSIDNLFPAMEVRGFVHRGYNPAIRQRAELHGQPLFSGLCGPMFNGYRDGVEVIRYEDQDAYNLLST